MSSDELMLIGIVVGIILAAPTIIDWVRRVVSDFDENEND
jgi:hypothetical protein